MKNLMIGLILGCFITLGFSQSQNTENKKNASVPKGPSIEKVHSDEKNNHYRKQLKVEELKVPVGLDKGKMSFTRDVKISKQKSASSSMSEIRAKRILKSNRSRPIGQESDQIYSQTKFRKRLKRSDGYAQRIEIKKIEGYSPVSEDVILRALGNVRPIKANNTKTEENK